jgi:hypothetical protein
MNKVKLLAGLLLVALCSFAPADWVTIMDREGGFKVSFPRKPEVTERTLDTKAGPAKMVVYTHDVGKFKDDNNVYRLMYADLSDSMIHSDFKDAIIDEFFRNTIKSSISNADGMKLSEIKINYKDYPGRRVKMSYMEDKGMMYMQFYLVNSRLYIIQVGCEKALDNNKAIEKFLTSFELL